MPTISIFIRKDDLRKWKALENKSKWLHFYLNNGQKLLSRLASNSVTSKKTPPDPSYEPMDTMP